MSSDGLTLHEAMAEVLRRGGGGWMDRDEIAAEIARRDLFRRPSDGAHPPSDQLRMRARKPDYQHLFECSDTKCSRIRLRSGVSEEPRPGVSARKRAADGPSVRTGDESRKPPRDQRLYEDLRQRYKPDRLRVLLVGESPPDSGDGQLRFFYSPTLRADNLYRGVAQAMYGNAPAVDVRDKTSVLERLQRDGFWLIDAVDDPVNKLGEAERWRAIANGVPRLIDRCRELGPERGVIICHGKVYKAAAQPLQDAGVVLLHDEPLPFPLGNWRSQFVQGFRRALSM